MRHQLFLHLAIVVLAVSPLKAEKSDITFINESGFDIHEIYLSPSEEREWGPDQLDDDVLEDDSSLRLHSIECGEFDIKLVDEDDDECIVEEVDLCGESVEWRITPSELLGCEWDSE